MKVDIKHGTMTFGKSWLSKGQEKPSVRVTLDLTEDEKSVVEELGIIGAPIVELRDFNLYNESGSASTYDYYVFTIGRCQGGHEAPFNTSEDARLFETAIIDALRGLKDRIEANKGGREDKTIEL